MTLTEKQIEMKKRWVTRQCTQCHKDRPEKHFKLKLDRPAQPNRRKSKCRTCDNRRGRYNRRQWLNQYWSTHPCVDCGEADIDVLEFDHRDPTKKSGLVTRMGSAASAEAEAAKCDVRCANCHRRRHARERRLNALRKVNLDIANRQ